MPIDTPLGKWFHGSMMGIVEQLKKWWEELTRFVVVGGDLA